MKKMTIDKEIEQKIIDDLEILGTKIRKSDKVNGKDDAIDAYKKAIKLLK